MSYLIKDTAVSTARTLDEVLSFFLFRCLSIFNLFHDDVCMYYSPESCDRTVTIYYYNNGGYIKRENIT